MNDTPTKVLLVESDFVDGVLIRDAIAVDSSIHVEWVTRLSTGLERLSRSVFEVILLDLMLPDGRGLEVFDRVFQDAPNVLILILSGAKDEETARRAVQGGAYDHFAKDHVDAHWLPRALRYMIERKRVQDALWRSEARFRAMSDASPLGIFVSDAKGACTYSNAAYQKISGLTFEQTLGTNWRMAIHPEDRRRVLAEWRDAAKNQEPFQSEVRFLRKDASVMWMRLNAAAISHGTTSQGYVHTIEDITERKSTE